MRKTLNFGLVLIAVLGLVLSASVAMAAEEKADINGFWELNVESPSGGGTPTMDLKESGGKITGAYVGALGETDVKGELKGNKFTIKFDAAGLDIVYKGKLKGDTISGSVDLGPYGMGTFNGKKKK